MPHLPKSFACIADLSDPETLLRIKELTSLRIFSELNCIRWMCDFRKLITWEMCDEICKLLGLWDLFFFLSLSRGQMPLMHTRWKHFALCQCFWKYFFFFFLLFNLKCCLFIYLFISDKHGNWNLNHFLTN